MSETVTGQTQSFNSLVVAQAAIVQNAASTTATLDFTIGSVLRAIVEGSAWLGLWLQSLILQLLTVTRASTSVGADLDTWMADFGVARISGTYAEGQITFSRYTPTSSASIPLGATVISGDGTQTYAVIADTTQSLYSATASAYILPAGQSTGNVTVQNTVAGPGGNVAAGLVSQLGGSISGIDYVVNASPMAGGASAESDAALRARFQTYIGTRAQATVAAIGYAVSSTPDVVSYNITQNYDYSGAYDPGSFYVVIDDGSGNPPGSLITSVQTAVAAVCGCGIRSAVYGATSETANVVMTMVAASGYTHSVVAPGVQTTVATYINSLALGATLSYAGVSAAAVGVPGVGSITGLTINGGTSDLAATSKQVIRSGTVTVN